MERSNSCDHGFGPCTAPDTLCPHWMGIFCEFDTIYDKNKKWIEVMNKIDEYAKEHPEVVERAVKKFSDQLVDVKDIALGDKAIWREEK